MNASISVNDVHLKYKLRTPLTLARRHRNAINDGRIEGAGRSQHVSALNGISFSLQAGDRLGLVGRNGAGKTTLLKVLFGIYQPSFGHVDVEGRVDALFNINLGFRPGATGRRNIILRGLVNGWQPEEIEAKIEPIIEFSELGDFIDMPLNSYSQGMAARLAFSIATSFQPEILLMDEWIGAGDPDFQAKARTRMTELTAQAGIIVLASHNKDLLAKTCNKILVLNQGTTDGIVTMEEWTNSARE